MTDVLLRAHLPRRMIQGNFGERAPAAAMRGGVRCANSVLPLAVNEALDLARTPRSRRGTGKWRCARNRRE
jgi:hypothetical protein